MTDKQEPLSPQKAGGADTIMKADVEKMIRDWQDECADHPALHNQGNVLLDRLKALKPSLAMSDFLTGMDCVPERPRRGDYAHGLRDGLALAVESREAIKEFLPDAYAGTDKQEQDTAGSAHVTEIGIEAFCEEFFNSWGFVDNKEELRHAVRLALNAYFDAENSRREREFISLSRGDVEALLLGAPKDKFTAALIRLASWFEGRPIDIEKLPYSPSPEPQGACG